VPYKGGGAAMTELLAGQVHLYFNSLPTVLPRVRAAKLKALAVGSAKRSPAMPELPTIAESGLKYDTSGWYGLVAPRHTGKAATQTLHAALLKALARPETKERLATLGIDPIGSTPEAFNRFLKEELAKWAQVIKAANLKAQ